MQIKVQINNYLGKKLIALGEIQEAFLMLNEALKFDPYSDEYKKIGYKLINFQEINFLMKRDMRRH